MISIIRNKLPKELFTIRTLVRTFATEPVGGISQPAELTQKVTNEKDNDDIIDIPNPFEQEKQKCILCRLNITPNYKNFRLLSQFQSPYTGRIYGRHITGLCKKRQEQVEREIIKAQNCAFMPSYHKSVEYVHDPKLFNPEKPIRPHKY